MHSPRRNAAEAPSLPSSSTSAQHKISAPSSSHGVTEPSGAGAGKGELLVDRERRVTERERLLEGREHELLAERGLWKIKLQGLEQQLKSEYLECLCLLCLYLRCNTSLPNNFLFLLNVLWILVRHVHTHFDHSSRQARTRDDAWVNGRLEMFPWLFSYPPSLAFFFTLCYAYANLQRARRS